MTVVDEARYRLVGADGATAHDALLDRPVTLVRVPVDDPGRVSRLVRSLAPSPWVQLLDCYVDGPDVVAVLPTAESTLSELLDVGLPSSRAEQLLSTLDQTLAALSRIGLAPATLDARRVGVDAAGRPLLVPAPGPRAVSSEQAALLTRLAGAVRATPTARTPAALRNAATALERGTGGGDDEPSLDPHRATSTRRTLGAAASTALVDSPVPLTAPSPVAAPSRLPRPQVTAPAGGRAGRTARRRTALLAAGTAAAVLAVGVLVNRQDDGPAERREPVTAPVSAAAVEQGLQRSIAQVASAPQAAGRGGSSLLRRLRAVQALRGPQRTFAAAGVVEAVRVGREDGTLKGPQVETALRAVTPLAQPADLPSLVSMLQVDPGAFGPGTAALLPRLVALRDELRGDAARTEASRLAALAEAGPARGQFTNTFAALAAPVLRATASTASTAAPALLGGTGPRPPVLAA